ncbi:amino-acid transporter subunit; periplasmic-binding component of ABC superfamily [Mesorhizobium metallidurans STM 2683]|uniref:Amino-acid transporter subunit periplasmic-binding component of ABC superfamily n=1 Tax=Mesorhizobium metallidurans STM 2683 TaxID=1297569 RepID=M5ETW1_9HYPH|nr:transporter substrate-binding domain-containing protein [Mesorhizobium metallidurans]CCV08414.1 amino-acid transporter subunit; periplasmic-binding component of ABC superfamily [Mesorhizobium metallidurans STM 2683]
MQFRKFKSAAAVGLGIAASALFGTPADAQTVVNKIKERGYVSCGASQGVPGLSRPDEKGYYRGFDSDICRTFAVAILGGKDKIRFVPLNAGQRFSALQTGEIDILSRTSTLTFTRDTVVRFVWLTLYDVDGLLVRKADNIKDPKQLDGRTVCLQGGGSLTEKAIQETEAEYNIAMEKVYFDSTIQARDAFFGGRCDSYVTDGTAAAGQRATVAKNPDDYAIIRVGSTVEPNGVAIARGDDQLFDIVRWTVNALLWAEANGIDSKNIDEKLKTGSDEVKRVLGEEPGFGKPVGLDDKWVYNVIRQMGNYSEIWDNNLGKNSPLKVERGMNALAKDGGLNYPLPWD